MGNSQDPITLHKYLYTHANPVNGIDPSGYFQITEISTAQKGLSGLYAVSAPSYSGFLVKATLGAATATAGLLLTEGYVANKIIEDCIKGKRDCKPDVSIFVVADSHDEIRDHVADAQASGSPSIVTRRASAHPRGWIRKFKRAGAVCQGSGQCDEYPMAIHVQGGEFGMTSLRNVNGSQNGSIGGMVAQFHRRCGVNVGENYKFVAVKGVPISGGICSGRD